jgi:hypothetical protein
MRKIIDGRDPNCPYNVQDAAEGDLLIVGTEYDPDYSICKFTNGVQMRFERITAAEFDRLSADIVSPPTPEPEVFVSKLKPRHNLTPEQLAERKRQALAEIGVHPAKPRELVDNPELTIALRRMRYMDGRLAAIRQEKGEEVW